MKKMQELGVKDTSRFVRLSKIHLKKYSQPGFCALLFRLGGNGQYCVSMKIGFEPKAPSTALVRVWRLDLFVLWMLIRIDDYTSIMVVDAAGHGVCQVRKMPLMSFGISDCFTVDGIKYLLVQSFLIKNVSLLSIHIIFMMLQHANLTYHVFDKPAQA
ncbi:hypothetical protein SADUNF_Sadunf06G0133000 [Salix dunnii]|uniref:Uncharacterized protein n=1 Tax=Salix dunnii TaxID=1413687 RepID=A0A835JZX9_9ROSI|nr:hypothetical protein SADUNF_Sadunf06G0133000 [Salix dunnii]